eukprot:TRINITY_DN8114_c0_g1_i1.p1 TRINITY_DN8114_c0_g1~~TRINITY_DN8114_c0_g1_i1.p1  ORF type:complete len:208 (+),score=67.67 TRINITY_DN8114_c0_g1_i1:87-710(+)
MATAGPVQLVETREDKERYDGLADLYSLLMTLERVEKAYVRAHISPETYQAQCHRLLSAYRMSDPVLKERGVKLKEFIAEFHMSVPHAEMRIQVGHPQTVVDGTGKTAHFNPTLVSATTEAFINLIDALKLEQHSSENASLCCVECLNKLNQAAPNLAGIEVIKSWASKLDKWQLSQPFPAEEERQMAHDVEKVYSAWQAWLAKAGG